VTAAESLHDLPVEVVVVELRLEIQLEVQVADSFLALQEEEVMVELL
jgi:hypothetical protein